MQQTILPDAQRLYEETSARVDAETTASTRIPAPVILVVLATLLFGAFANRWLARRTRRRVNIGFVAGGMAVLIMLIWVGTALVDLDRRQPQRQGHRRRVAQDRHQPGHHRAAGACRRDAVADPARRRGRPQAVLLPTHRHHAAAAVRLPGPRRRDRQGRPGRRRTAAASAGARPTTGSTPTSRSATTRPPPRWRWAPARTTRRRRSTSSTRRCPRASRRAATNCAATSSTPAGCCPARPSAAAVLSVMAALAVALGLWPRMSEYR